MTGRRFAIAALMVLTLSGLAIVWWRSADDVPATDDATEETRPATTLAEGIPAQEPPTDSLVPTSTPDRDDADRAEAAIGYVRDRLTLTDAQARCLSNRVATDPDLLDAIGTRPEPDTPAFDALVGAAQWCIAVLDLAPAFVDGIAPSLATAPDDDDRACLATAFADLTDDRRRAIVDAGLRPDGPDAEAGRDDLDRLLATCDLALRR